MPRRRRFLLLDLDGVILDNDQYEPEFERLAEPAFVPLLGGEGASWFQHQEPTWQRVWQRGCRQYVEDRGVRGLNLARWWDRLHAEWIDEMCVVVGVDPPPTFEKRVDVAEQALTFFFQNTRSIVPAAASTISELSQSFEIHMASGNPGWVIETVLVRLGVRNHVGNPFGSDLLGLQKGHNQFYPAILDAIGAGAQEVIVVDDDHSALVRAGKLGILTVKVGGTRNGDHDHGVETIAKLPDLLNSLDSQAGIQVHTD